MLYLFLLFAGLCAAAPSQPIAGSLGAPMLGPHNPPLEAQNKDFLAPPSTDHGLLPNMKWPFSLSHTRLAKGGWARQQTVIDLPIATDLAVCILLYEVPSLNHVSYRSELHWHTAAEVRRDYCYLFHARIHLSNKWAYVLEGEVRISTITPEGEVFVGDVSSGDLWYFPAGIPHSLQAKNTTTAGAEFVLIFDSGDFSEESTFGLIDWLAHTPKDVIAKNFGVADNQQLFAHIPDSDLFIFQSDPPPSDVHSDQVIPNDAQNPYVFPLSKVAPTKTTGGSYKVVDSRTFKVAEKVSAVEVTVEVGGMRELHWHPTQPEWCFFITGEAKATVFASSAVAQTFDFQFIQQKTSHTKVGAPRLEGHYVENTGNTTLKFLEVFKSNLVQDISLNQWLALTPPELVKSHLGFSDEMIAKLKRNKQVVV
ncbi:hypothetical protein V5O48_002994 [Marasmius crinis-equi]|uniref:Cupin type-1 domain-containing protein n=1 Tax=Marasmius crinis-equi TaxID=585013 RepID=A0ABR3FU26_9AGAR